MGNAQPCCNEEVERSYQKDAVVRSTAEEGSVKLETAHAGSGGSVPRRPFEHPRGSDSTVASESGLKAQGFSVFQKPTGDGSGAVATEDGSGAAAKRPSVGFRERLDFVILTKPNSPHGP